MKLLLMFENNYKDYMSSILWPIFVLTLWLRLLIKYKQQKMLMKERRAKNNELACFMSLLVTCIYDYFLLEMMVERDTSAFT